jgi:alpha-glucosidase (family GH31 glycosyl hydrolase)
VLEPGARKRSIYLPRGRWVDLWRSLQYRRRDGSLRLRRTRLLAGRRNATLPAPLTELPLLARAGALLALLPADVDTLAPYGRGRDLVGLRERRGRLHLIAFPRGASSGRYLAHGRLRSREGGDRWTLEIDDTRRRRWSVQVALGTMKWPFRPCEVAVEGRPLADSVWEYRQTGRVLRAEFRAGREARLTVDAC